MYGSALFTTLELHALFKYAFNESSIHLPFEILNMIAALKIIEFSFNQYWMVTKQFLYKYYNVNGT